MARRDDSTAARLAEAGAMKNHSCADMPKSNYIEFLSPREFGERMGLTAYETWRILWGRHVPYLNGVPVVIVAKERGAEA